MDFDLAEVKLHTRLEKCPTLRRQEPTGSPTAGNRPFESRRHGRTIVALPFGLEEFFFLLFFFNLALQIGTVGVIAEGSKLNPRTTFQRSTGRGLVRHAHHRIGHAVRLLLADVVGCPHGQFGLNTGMPEDPVDLPGLAAATRPVRRRPEMVG
ncbi:MAG: hypothetical protein AB7U30_13665, partial [Sulfuricellaceae bacterium]